MRKPKNKILLLNLSIILLALALPGCTKAKKGPDLPITVKAVVDKAIVAIGDKIKYTMLIEKDKDIEIEPPVFSQILGSFAIKDFGTKRSVSISKDKISQWYILDTYITGKTTIPKATIKYKRKNSKDWSQVDSNEVFVEVKSSLGKAGPNTQMRDIKEPVSLPSIVNKYFILVGALLLVALGLFTGYFLKKNKEAVVIPKKPAHEIAYEQLEQLLEKDYIGQGKIKEYYTEISDIIRRYLENRFALRAPEMTTEEFLIRVRDAGELIGEHKNLLKEFLLCCDLVKFAKYAPAVDEINSIFNSAKNFIDQTKENEPA